MYGEHSETLEDALTGIRCEKRAKFRTRVAGYCNNRAGVLTRKIASRANNRHRYDSSSLLSCARSPISFGAFARNAAPILLSLLCGSRCIIPACTRVTLHYVRYNKDCEKKTERGKKKKKGRNRLP